MRYVRHAKSSNLHSSQYNEDTKTLTTTFLNEDGGAGSTYRYAGVEPETVEGLINADSAGSYFHQNIKSRIKGVKI